MAITYDVSDVDLQFNINSAGLETVTDLAPDGFGITPGSENTLIPSLVGTTGFSIDPSDTVDITVTLLSSSAWNKKFNDGRKQTMAISINSNDSDSTGWKSITIANVMVQKRPEWSTNEKEQPMVEWNFIGYNVTPTYP